MKQFLRSIPCVGRLLLRVYAKILRKQPFPGSRLYWENRYASGGNSGAGSYNRLAVFKANYLNAFLHKHRINRVIELGCGDGSQLELYTQLTRYIGLDVSPAAIEMCIAKYRQRIEWSFAVFDGQHCGGTAELCISFDVIYHLVEDEVFENYMDALFRASTRFVMIYSSNYDSLRVHHVKHRRFTEWIEANFRNWCLLEQLDNRYPFCEADPDNTSFADFYVYRLGEAMSAD